MKKIISVIALIAVLMGVFAVCALADAKDDIIAKAEDVCPDGYESEYIPAAKNILNQIKVTDEQATAVNAAIEDARAIVNSGKGTRLADYTEAEKKQVLGDEKPITCRFADTLEPQFEKTKAELAGIAKNDEDVLSYIAFPQVAERFFEAQKEKEEKKVAYTIEKVEG